MCTSLSYADASGKIYFGRTLELTLELPYLIAWFPVGFAAESRVDGCAPLAFRARHGVLAVTMPIEAPAPGQALNMAALKIVEGVNDAGLTFSLLSYPAASGGARRRDPDRPMLGASELGASELGAWVLGGFATVAEVKAALAEQPVATQALALLGGVESPFHYVLHDPSGASLVIEFDQGDMSLHDNPVGVMTNGPAFPWHLTNLNNYTHLTNLDAPTAQFGDFRAAQPDSGIATAGLPASNTSVGRFIRAVFYRQFAAKAASPEAALRMLAHVMNNFDRPRGLTLDDPRAGGGLEVAGLAPKPGGWATEFTSWTSLCDLDRRIFLIRDEHSLNYVRFDLKALAGLEAPRVIPLADLAADAVDATARLQAAG